MPSQNGIWKKFDTSSARVKTVVFHTKRPWVLCGLHNGVAQIWDYRMRTLVDSYHEHEGAIRGADFHCNQPIFVTGGDDFDVRVWNFKLKRCLYALHGHLDFVRSVQFHKSQPWIASASDDHTIRIWNWQSRICLSVLTGHNHFVMCAQFHLREPLLLTSSEDRSIRVWDMSGLLVSKARDSAPLPQDFFGSSDVVVKFNLEGHEKGVNWAVFHPSKNLIVSASSDRTIRVWRMDETRCYEIDQFRGHVNDVCSVMYFGENIISCSSGDRTVRVWDPSSRAGPLITYRRDDRFWTLAGHPGGSLVAAGHDNGMLVFKLKRERPAFTIINNVLHWVSNSMVNTYDFATKATHSCMSLRRHAQPPNTVSCNPADSMAVFWYEGEGGYYELCTIPKPGQIANQETKKGVHYSSAVFFSAGKFACLDRSNQIIIRTSTNDASKSPLPPVGNSNRIFPGPPGFILLRSETAVYLFHVAQKAVVSEIAVNGVRHVVWDKDFNRLALLNRHSIQICTRKLKPITTIFESPARVKSACFDDDRDVLLFTTSNHLKYCNLRTVETGTIRTTEDTVYLVRACQNEVWFLTREGKVVHQEIENLELTFKIALQQERFRDVLKIIQTRKLQGQALVSYLEKHGHPEIAMHFVSDPWIKFNLAVESGDMAIAKQSALEMDKPEAWRTLAETATRFGDIQLAQLANSKANNLHALGHQCLLTGDMNTLKALTDKSKDLNFQMQYSLFTNDVEKRLNVLLSAGQLPLAHALASSNGMTEIADDILSKMSPEVADRCRKNKVHTPPKPEPVEPVTENWPALPVQESYFTRMLKEPGLLDYNPEAADDDEGKVAWGDDDDDLFGDEGGNDSDDIGGGAAEGGAAGGGAWEDDDLDIDMDLPAEAAGSAPSKDGNFIMPREGESLQKHWVDHSLIPAFHVSAGSFATAIDLLKRQVGLVDAEPLRDSFMALWAATNASMPSFATLPSHNYAVPTKPSNDELEAKHSPMVPQTINALTESLNKGYQATTEGRFEDALNIFHATMYMCLLCVIDDRKDLATIQNVLNTSKEYATALTIELFRKTVTDPKRSVELATYFTHCKLQNAHLVLGLRQGMVLAFKQKCFATASILAKRMLEYEPKQDVALKARKVVEASAKEGGNDAVQLDYNDRNPFQLCVVDKTPMYRGTVEPIRCTFCFAVANPKYANQKCPICKIGKLGGIASGMISGAFQL